MMIFVCGVFWLVFVVACLGFVPEPFGLWINVIGLLTLVVHFSEYFLFNKKVMGKGDSKQKAFLMTMFMGLFYWYF